MAIGRGAFLRDPEDTRVVDALRVIDAYFQDKHGISASSVLELMEKDEPKIPLSAFSTDSLSSLEVVVKYLKEVSRKTYHEIAVLLDRNDRTIWSTYNNSRKKQVSPLSIERSAIRIPASVFADRRYSTLEALVKYLKESAGLSFKEMAQALKKDYQTVWTTYRKVTRK